VILTGLFLMLKIGGVLDMSWWWIVLFLAADHISTDVTVRNK